METRVVVPESPEERIVWYTMIGTYGFYLLGALYAVVPVMAWFLFGYGIWKLATDPESFRTDKTSPAGSAAVNRTFPPPSVLIWVLGMMLMLFALIVGHVNYGIDVVGTVKSIIGWAKGWALLAIFPIIGCLSIRPEVIYRAACIVCLHTLILLPVFIGAWLFNLPQTLYVSPISIIGGPGPEFFSLNLYEIEPGTGAPRWRFFTPWAPAIGFVANIYFIFALQEKDTRWRWIGIIACVIMIIMSKSRLALVSLATIWFATWMLVNLSRPIVLYLSGVFLALFGFLAVSFFDLVQSFVEAFRNARAGSSRIRSALARIAVDRWQREAPIWGHGVVERGSHNVEYMYIGSHHTWYGLLFVKGIVGFMALAIPMLVSFFALWRSALTNDVGKVGVSIILILFLYTFGENLEILPYLIWPGLLFIGLGVKPMVNRDSSS